MTRNILRLAMAGAALAVAGIVVAACSSGSSGGTSGGTPVLKSNGNPANYACNHTNYLPASLGRPVTQIVFVQDQGTSVGGNPNPAPGTRVAVFDPVAGTTSATIAASTTTGGGQAHLALTDNTIYGFKLTNPNPGPFVDSYDFNHLSTSTAGQGTTIVNTRIIEKSAYGILGSLANGGVALPTNLTSVAASVADCDGSSIQNATVQLAGAAAPSCAASPHVYPCVAYFAGGVPNTQAGATDKSGDFIVVGLTPGTATGIQSFGLVSTTAGPAAVLGELDVYGVPGSVALGAVTPCTKAAPGCK